jgi:3-deoxy-7-phosphoheptulonate synthase
MVSDMAVAACAAGADGLIIEVHPDPSTAMSDGYQSLTFDAFRQTMKRCQAVIEALRAVDRQ